MTIAAIVWTTGSITAVIDSTTDLRTEAIDSTTDLRTEAIDSTIVVIDWRTAVIASRTGETGSRIAGTG